MKTKNMIIIILFIIVGLLSGLYFYLNNNILSLNTIYDGISIDHIYVGQLTEQEALDKIKTHKYRELEKNNLKLYYKDYTRQYNIRDLGFSYNYELAVNKAFKLGRYSNKLDRLKEIYRLKEDGKNIDLESNIDKDTLGKIIGEIEADINKEPIDSKLSFEGGTFSYTNSSIGYRLDKEKLFRQMLESMYSEESIALPVEVLEPRVTTDSLRRINGLIGTATSSYKTSSEARKENIRISANAFKGRLILPGEEVSYNETTGPRSRESGYQEANVIINREFVPGLGGGVCQTSTTLYQALLDADLSIVERHPHSIPPGYVERGTDAAVAYGSLDLRFKNDFDFPIYIDTVIEGDRVSFNIYGDKNIKNYQVRIEPDLQEIIDPKVLYKEDKNLEAGVEIQRGRKGYKVDTFKSLIKNGKEIEKKRISRDYYRERDYIYSK